jgi:hypothetical protein
MNTIKSRWELFETMCLQGVTDQDRNKAQVAFYAGVVSLLKLQEKAARKIDSPEQAAEFVKIWQQELDVFKSEVAAKAVVAMAQMRH